MCTNDLRRIGNLDCVMGDTAENKYSTSSEWRVAEARRVMATIGAVNSRYEWIVQSLGVIF